MKRYAAPVAILFTFYSVCFLGASFNHARDILFGGLLPYRDAPLLINVFWTSLAFIDPMVPFLFIIGRTKPALLLALAIMVTDVAVNTQYAYNHRDSVYGGNIDLMAQTAFLIFVLVTVPIAWNALASKAT